MADGYYDLEFSPNYASDGTIAVVVPGAGLFLSTDRGTDWQDVLPGESVTAAAIGPSGIVYAGADYTYGTQDGVYASFDKEQNWQNIGLEGSEISTLNYKDPQTLDLYSYADDNPVSNVDPSGHYDEIICLNPGTSGAINIELTKGVVGAVIMGGKTYTLSSSGGSAAPGSSRNTDINLASDKNYGTIIIDAYVPDFDLAALKVTNTVLVDRYLLTLILEIFMEQPVPVLLLASQQGILSINQSQAVRVLGMLLLA